MRKTAMIATALMATTALPALGASAVGLIGDRSLVLIDTESAEVTAMRPVGIEGRLLGIDYRAPTGTLIGVTDTFAVVEIDPETGVATQILQMDTPLPITEGTPVIVDINPSADALRFMSGTVNHRVNMSTGAVNVDGDLFYDGTEGVSGTPQISATGYTNNIGQPGQTAMYNIDPVLGVLLRQDPPNDGRNIPVGPLGVEFEHGNATFDVGTSADGTNTGWATSGLTLHQIDLESGAVTGSWPIAGLEVPLRGLTIMP